jgi:hypothetical protein
VYLQSISDPAKKYLNFYNGTGGSYKYQENTMTATDDCYLYVSVKKGTTTSSVKEHIPENQVALKQPLYKEWKYINPEGTYDNLVWNIYENHSTSMNGSSYCKINLTNEDSLIISGRAESVGYVPLCAFYDETNSLIDYFPKNVSNKTYVNETVIVPSQSSYVIVNGYVDLLSVKGYDVGNLENAISKRYIHPYSDKKLVLIGTSVGWGSGAHAAYIQEASEKAGFNFINASVPGNAIQIESDGTITGYGSLSMTKNEYLANGVTIATSPEPFTPNGSYNNYYRTWENVFTESNANADIYLFATIPNNSNYSLTDWNDFDYSNWRYEDDSAFSQHRTTFLGAMLYLMDKMYESNPYARMALVVDSGFNYEAGLDNFKRLSEKFHIPIIDMFGEMNITPPSITKIQQSNGADKHPTTFAHRLMGDILSGKLMSIK